MPDAKHSPDSKPSITRVNYSSTVIIAAVVVTIIVLGSVASSPPTGLKVTSGILEQLGSMFGFLLMISLFVERAVEVVISIWSDPEADKLEQELEALAEARSRQSVRIEGLLAERAAKPEPLPERLEKINKELDELRDKIWGEQDRDDEIEMELVKYSAHTRKVSTWVGLGHRCAYCRGRVSCSPHPFRGGSARRHCAQHVFYSRGCAAYRRFALGRKQSRAPHL